MNHTQKRVSQWAKMSLDITSREMFTRTSHSVAVKLQ